jgi:hypothetical protein
VVTSCVNRLENGNRTSARICRSGQLERLKWRSRALIPFLLLALDTHGLFRISGNQLDINQWKEMLNAHDGNIPYPSWLMCAGQIE